MTAPPLLAALALIAAHPDVERGLALFERLEYDRAVVMLGRALAEPDLPTADRLTALQTLALSYAVLDDETNATRTFHRLLDLSPRYEIDRAKSPRLVRAFDGARSAWVKGRNITFTLLDDSDRLEGTMTGDPERVGRVVAIDAAGVRTSLLCEGARCRCQRPTSQFTLEVYDHVGAILTRSGPHAAASKSFPTWVIWAGIGAAVVAGGIATIVLVDGRSPPDGSLGRVNLP